MADSELIRVALEIVNPQVFEQIEKLRNQNYTIKIRGDLDSTLKSIFAANEITRKITFTVDSRNVTQSLQNMETQLKQIQALSTIELKAKTPQTALNEIKRLQLQQYGVNTVGLPTQSIDPLLQHYRDQTAALEQYQKKIQSIEKSLQQKPQGDFRPLDYPQTRSEELARRYQQYKAEDETRQNSINRYQSLTAPVSSLDERAQYIQDREAIRNRKFQEFADQEASRQTAINRYNSTNAPFSSISEHESEVRNRQSAIDRYNIANAPSSSIEEHETDLRNRDEAIRQYRVRSGQEDGAFSKVGDKPRPFIDISRLGEDENKKLLGFSFLDRGLPGLIGGAVGGSIAGGSVLGGAALVSTVFDKVVSSGEALAEKLIGAAEAGLRFEDSVKGVAAIYDAQTHVVNDQGQRVTGLQAVTFQEKQAREVQLQARGELSKIGISGDKESLLVQSIVAGAASRGIVLTPEQVTTLSARIGGAVQSLRPELTNNPGRFRAEVEDYFTGQRSSLTSILKPFAPDLAKATSGEDFIKRSEGLKSFPDFLQETNSPAQAIQNLSAAFDQLNTVFGDELLKGLVPGIKSLTEVLRDPDTVKNAQALGKVIGELGSKFAQGAAELLKILNKFNDKGPSGKTGVQKGIEAANDANLFGGVPLPEDFFDQNGFYGATPPVEAKNAIIDEKSSLFGDAIKKKPKATEETTFSSPEAFFDYAEDQFNGGLHAVIPISKQVEQITKSLGFSPQDLAEIGEPTSKTSAPETSLEAIKQLRANFLPKYLEEQKAEGPAPNEDKEAFEKRFSESANRFNLGLDIKELDNLKLQRSTKDKLFDTTLVSGAFAKSNFDIDNSGQQLGLAQGIRDQRQAQLDKVNATASSTDVDKINAAKALEAAENQLAEARNAAVNAVRSLLDAEDKKTQKEEATQETNSIEGQYGSLNIAKRGIAAKEADIRKALAAGQITPEEATQGVSELRVQSQNNALRQLSISEESTRRKALGFDTGTIAGRQGATEVGLAGIAEQRSQLEGIKGKIPESVYNERVAALDAKQSAGERDKRLQPVEAATSQLNIQKAGEALQDAFHSLGLKTKELVDKQGELSESIVKTKQALDQYDRDQNLRSLGRKGKEIADAEAYVSAGGDINGLQGAGADIIDILSNPGSKAGFQQDLAQAQFTSDKQKNFSDAENEHNGFGKNELQRQLNSEERSQDDTSYQQSNLYRGYRDAKFSYLSTVAREGENLRGFDSDYARSATKQATDAEGKLKEYSENGPGSLDDISNPLGPNASTGSGIGKVKTGDVSGGANEVKKDDVSVQNIADGVKQIIALLSNLPAKEGDEIGKVLQSIFGGS